MENLKKRKNNRREDFGKVTNNGNTDDSESENESGTEDNNVDQGNTEDSESENESGTEDNNVDQARYENSESEDESESDDDDKQDTSEESEDESDSDESSDDEDVDHKWQELRNEAPDATEITRRIAVCNMDWDRIRAVDLLLCFQSFKPAGGSVNSVKIYPSEFGLKRMEEERLKGPRELTEKSLPLDQEETVDKEGAKFHREKLREYQINRLKYYYAVVECDSPETANTIYEQLNGMEYESSAVRFDLRFIPDDTVFDHEPTSVADETLDPSEYKPRLFVTTALQQVKVNLTWDETDPKRTDFFDKIFTAPDTVENEIADYLASASSDSEVETETADNDSNKKLSTKERIAKYQELLASIEEKEKEEVEGKYDIEVTWELGLKEKTQKKVKEKMEKDSLNPFDEFLQKRKEKKKEQKKIQKQAQDSDDGEEGPSGTDWRSENKTLAELALITDSNKEATFEENTRKKKTECPELQGFVPNMNDPRFSAMHTSSLFNVAPSRRYPKNEGNFGLKRSKEWKFKPRGQKYSKRGRF